MRRVDLLAHAGQHEGSEEDLRRQNDREEEEQLVQAERDLLLKHRQVLKSQQDVDAIERIEMSRLSNE